MSKRLTPKEIENIQRLRRQMEEKADKERAAITYNASMWDIENKQDKRLAQKHQDLRAKDYLRSLAKDKKKSPDKKIVANIQFPGKKIVAEVKVPERQYKVPSDVNEDDLMNELNALDFEFDTPPVKRQYKVPSDVNEDDLMNELNALELEGEFDTPPVKRQYKVPSDVNEDDLIAELNDLEGDFDDIGKGTRKRRKYRKSKKNKVIVSKTHRVKGAKKTKKRRKNIKKQKKQSKNKRQN